MNVRLAKQLGWYNGLVYNDRFLVNHSTIELRMLTVSRDSHEQNIAYERMKYWIHNVLNDSILIAHDNPHLARYQETNARVIVLPEEPVDQILGIMLYLKLNAIMENRIVITDTEIWSSEGDSMSYLHSHGEDLGSALGQDGWWTDARPVWYDTRPQNNDSNIVNLDRIPEWKSYDLAWEDGDKKDNSVVFAKFNRNNDNDK